VSTPAKPSSGSSRNHGIAAVLGFVWPGVGYLYAGRGAQGLLLLLLFPAAELSIYLLAVLIPVAVVCVAVPAMLTLALHLLCARGAARAASAFPAERPIPVFSRWFSCLTAVMLGAVLNLFLVHGYRTTFVQAFKIPTGGMEPTIPIGDHLLATKWAYGWRDPVFGHLISDAKQPKRGDLIVFRFPEDRSRVFIKRCIGLPGETVEVRDRAVLVDGKALAEPYVQFLEPRLPSTGRDLGRPDLRGSWGPQTVPAGGYFVLGDNRDNSRDSRFWGFVPEEDLLGRATVVYWSYDARREDFQETGLLQWAVHSLSAFGRTRWERIGLRLE
jgi:signal peptidase I